MSIVVLFHSDVLTLASKSPVIPAHEAATLLGMVEQSERLSSRLASEDARMSEMQTSVQQQAHREGFAAGKQEGLQAAEKELLHERTAIAENHANVLQQATGMAFDIVRKLADTIDPVELLSALAITTARSCSPDEPLVLRVHEQYKEAVALKLQSDESQKSREYFRHVIGDSSIEPTACIIESPASRIVADLETQADLLESQLVKR